MGVNESLKELYCRGLGAETWDFYGSSIGSLSRSLCVPLIPTYELIVICIQFFASGGPRARKPRPYVIVAIRRRFLSSLLFTRLISYRSVV